MKLFLWVCGAFVYDVIILSALSMVLSAAFLGVLGAGFYQSEISRSLFQLAWFMLIVVYIGLSWLKGGQTIGMKAWKLVVTRDDGKPLMPMDVVTRLSAATLNLFLLNLGWLGYLSAQKMSLTDNLSKTIIVPLQQKD